MSLCRRGRENSSGKTGSIELSSILIFIRLIEYISCTILLVSIIGCCLIKDDEGAKVLYTMVIIISGFTTVGSIFGSKFLNLKINDK